jgi:6-oxocyclohex-1-ene-carbonyl-CoA hydrolase
MVSTKPAMPWQEGKALLKQHQANADFELLDKEVDKVIWKFANLFPACLVKSIDGISGRKRNSSGIP